MRWCSAERRDRPEALERRGERFGPGPVAIELEVSASAVTDEVGSGVKQPLAQAFGSAVASSPSRQISFVHAKRSWAISEVSNQVWLCSNA